MKTKQEAEERVADRFSIYGQVAIYLLVMAGLYFGVDGSENWIVWPALGWGIGIAFQIIQYTVGPDLFDSAVEREMKKDK